MRQDIVSYINAYGISLTCNMTDAAGEPRHAYPSVASGADLVPGL